MFYSVKFNRFNGYRSSISELHIGAPFNGCYMSRSPLQSFLEVQESWFQVRPCHDQRSTFYWNILFWSSSISLTSAEGDSSWTPMSQCEEWEKCFFALNHHLSNSAMRILINSMYWRVSVRVSAVLRQRACGPGYGERGAPDGTRELADGQAPLGRTGGPQALQWPKDVNFNGYNMVKLLALVGMKAVFKWREIVIFVRTRGCLCWECWTNLKSAHGAKSSSQVLPISEHRST